jgi:hypothetical protein
MLCQTMTLTQVGIAESDIQEVVVLAAAELDLFRAICCAWPGELLVVEGVKVLQHLSLFSTANQRTSISGDYVCAMQRTHRVSFAGASAASTGGVW